MNACMYGPLYVCMFVMHVCVYVCVCVYECMLRYVCYVMLGYVNGLLMLCYVMLCYVMLCVVMLCHVMLCYVMYVCM